MSYHYRRRSRRADTSVLGDIPGLGPKRRTLLLRRFGSVSALQGATIEDLRVIEGLPERVVEAVFRRLHG